MKDLFSTVLRFCVSIGFVVMGIVQFFAIYAFFDDHLKWHWLFSGIVSIVLAYVPVLGSIVGFLGALNAWHWSWLQAGLLFFWWPALFLIIYALGMGAVGIGLLKDKITGPKYP